MTIPASAPQQGGGVSSPKPVIQGLADTSGNWLDADSLPQTLTYNADGTLASIAATDGVSTWVKTLSYTSGVLSAISGWVKQ